MKALSELLSVTVVGLVIAGVAQVWHGDLPRGLEVIGWVFVPLALLLGFTWPTRCRVKTTRRKACGNDAYGFLFGCTKAAGHWKEKFLVRMGSRHGEVKPVERRQPAAAQAFTYQPVPQSQPIRVTVEDNARSICGFWLGAVSVVLAIAQTILDFTIH